MRLSLLSHGLRWAPAHCAGEGETRITLPPRNYILVHEDGRLHTKDEFEPMSFGMQRIHNDDEPEPVWVQTKTARWLQTASEVDIRPSAQARRMRMHTCWTCNERARAPRVPMLARACERACARACANSRAPTRPCS